MTSEQHVHVFIGGVHRSGTTLVGRLLAEHDGASGFADTGVPADEGQHLQSVYAPARAFGGPGRFAFAEDAALTETSALLRGARERLMADWGPHWDLSKRVLIEKSPPNLLRFRFLQAAFPGAHLIAVLRHPVAVAYATQKWSKTSIPSLLEHWLIAYERFGQDARRLERVHEVRYEALVADASATIESLETAIGLVRQTVSDSAEGGSNEHYFERWQADSGRAVSGFRLRRAARQLETRVNAFGYTLADLS